MISQKKLLILLWLLYMLAILTYIVAINQWHCITLQTTLDNFDEWSQGNNIHFKASKCKVLTVARKKNPIVYNYHLDQVQLERVHSEKDIGVVVTNTLSWDLHAQNIVKKANGYSGLLKRTCPVLTDVSVRRTLYLAHVKSQLSYATQVWSPYTISLKSAIEKVYKGEQRGRFCELLHLTANWKI